ncbi:hypothetical protein PCANC_15026 [Puccinia coronata f. sp. avenae]|uniref:Uncharacterized protein n=1 Tax=Puccinia coronata f. sp. avenae TaxID=200324 RepID=A0A2N5UZT7_9BASI|nr:hypothetical protein PCANC_15026 [Puccinia coronata f. sp. avenae]PLW43244.1 hypothetical protein PCASD_07022 [Puccinia coronata f. sp. avenae]
MRTILNLLIVGAQLTISCKGMKTGWQADEDELPCMINDWSGEDNEHLRQCTSHIIPQPSSHTSATDWYNSHVNNPYAARNTLSMGETSGRVTSRNNEIAQDAPERTLVGHIHMNKEELPVHKLIFDKNAFANRLNKVEEENVRNRLQFIEETIDKYSTRSSANTPTLMLPRDDLSDFINSFISVKNRPRSNAFQPSTVVSKAITNFLEPVPANFWRSVYHKRLGIDFGAVTQWLEEALRKYNPSPAFMIPRTAERLEQYFLVYIFFVDMIMTTIDLKAADDRIQSFHTAVSKKWLYFRSTYKLDGLL